MEPSGKGASPTPLDPSIRKGPLLKKAFGLPHPRVSLVPFHRDGHKEILFQIRIQEKKDIDIFV
jgi:hypothetical protein